MSYVVTPRLRLSAARRSVAPKPYKTYSHTIHSKCTGIDAFVNIHVPTKNNIISCVHINSCEFKDQHLRSFFKQLLGHYTSLSLNRTSICSSLSAIYNHIVGNFVIK